MKKAPDKIEINETGCCHNKIQSHVQNLLIHPLKHTFNIFLFILLINCVLGYSLTMASGGIMGGTAAGPWQNNEETSTTPMQSNKEQKEEITEWECSCGAKNKGKFCIECGKQKPATYKCNKCGWKPIDKTVPPKFCPECGDKFDNDDVE